MALNESIECIATLIDSNFIYRAFYYKREKEIQLTVCAKEVSSREEKSVDIFGFFASEHILIHTASTHHIQTSQISC